MSTSYPLLGEQEALFAAIVESSEDAIISKDLDGTILSWNKGAERIFGYSAAEVIGKPISILAIPERIEDIPNILQRIRAGERVEHYQTKRRTKDGRVLAISLTVSPVRDTTGKIVGASKIARDITGRKLAEQALRASEERFRAAINAVSSLLWTNNAQGHMEGEQPAWGTFTGQTFAEYQGHGWADAVHADDAQSSINAWTQAVAERRMFVFEHRVRRHDGVYRLFSIRAVPVFDDSGTIREWVGVHTDITEERQLLEALTRSNEDLLRANSDLEQFAYSASHDLREPLRQVALYSQLLQRRYRGKFDAEADEFLALNVRGARRMEALIAGLLSYAQAASLDDEKLTPIAASAVLDQALANLADTINETHAVITHVELPELRVHEPHLLQLFQNLLSNALKYRGDKTPEIQVSAEHGDGFWKIAIKDNGIGLDPNYADYIFGLFKRLHTADEYSGTGIGLALCQKVVHRYGGRIWVESEGKGRGSVFYFTVRS